MTVVIDASVWVAARFKDEPGYAESTSCLFTAMASQERIALPWLAWVECVAAVARKTNDQALATNVGRYLLDLDAVLWVALDENLASSAVDLAAECRLRAADAVYAAVARAYDAPLVTLDRELVGRCSAALPVQHPSEWIEGRQ